MSFLGLVRALAGGVLIGVAASALMVLQGRIAGISGIAAGVLAPDAADRGWRAAFLAGLMLTGVVAALVAPSAFGTPPLGAAGLLGAGVLVGVGARLGGGCTSGHGVCGIGRRSPRSLVAVAVFMLTGALTVAVLR